MSIIVKQILTIVLCLPGALVVGFYCSELAMWGCLPDDKPSQFDICCWFFWGGFGGASLGATPGLLLGYYYRMKWVRPFLGASVGALVGVFLGFARIENGPLYAALVLLGCIFGSWPFLTGSRTRTSRKPVEEAPVHGELLRDLDTNRSGRIVPKK